MPRDQQDDASRNPKVCLVTGGMIEAGDSASSPLPTPLPTAEK
jgi:hypothetical protein